ncbi:MAG: SagB/ThcOx family dehydrogenase [Chloroflexia bacterium]
MKLHLLGLFLVLFSLFGGACGGPAASPTGAMGEISLPPPQTRGGMSLTEALALRRSVRSYTEQPLTWEEVSQLLWAAQGVTDRRGFRTAPSAGALYPLEVYLVLPEGWYHYRPADHRLEVRGRGDLRRDIWGVGLNQEALLRAPAVFVLTGVVSRTAAKYGGRAERYVFLEAGHAAQNLLLQATALGLGAVPIGAFDDEGVRRVLGLPPDETPLYLIPVGRPGEP